jgi:hypothetical protein
MKYTNHGTKEEAASQSAEWDTCIKGAEGWPVNYSIHIKEGRNVCQVSEQFAGIYYSAPST